MLSTKISDPSKIDHLLSLTHSRPDPSYLFLYNELIEKNIQSAFIGKWDFAKIEELNKNPELLKRVPNRNSKEYIQFLWQLAGGPFKYNAPLTEIRRKNQLILFDGNIKIDMKSMTCQVNSPKFGKGKPQSIFYIRNGKVVEQIYEKASLPFSIILYLDNEKYNVVLLDRYLAKSMLMRLYYFGDTGLKYFRTFSEERDLTRRTEIEVFEINWDKFFADTTANQ